MSRFDYHMHTNFSSDSNEPMIEVVKQSIALGLEEIAITDHWDYVYPDKFFPYQIDYDKYIIALNDIRQQFKDKIKIVFGVEIGIGPHLDKAITTFVDKYNFDFIIGSVHDIKGYDLYIGDYFKEKPKYIAYNNYFQYLLDSIKAIKEICVIGHFDYVSRYGPYEDPMIEYNDFKEIIDEILKELISRGKGLEINTSGYRYGINNIYPNLTILKRYKELGGEIITVGSDAHKAKDIKRDFDKAYDFLKQAGFGYITIFRERKPSFIKID